MQVLAICLGLLSCIYLSECTFDAWTVPVLATGSGDAGTYYFNEGDTTIQTVAATVSAGRAVVSYAIETQTVAGFWAITSPAGVVTATAGVLDADATTVAHVLTIKSVDDTAGTALSATVTVTYSIVGGQFTTGYSCHYLASPTAAATTILTNGMQSGGTNAITIDSGNTNTDFSVVSATGVLTTANIVSATSGTSGSYTLILKGIESIGTASTVYSTVNICILGSSCVCSMSSAATVTASLLVMLASAIMMLLK